MPDTLPYDPIHPALSDLLALFEGPLKGVRFPDVDHGVLGELAEAVRRAAEEVEQARALLEAAEAALEERRQALLSRGQRALAYARVYADGNAELRGEIDRIALPGSGLRVESREPEAAAAGEPARRRPGRPRKVREGAPLFALPDAGEAPAAE
ncbi:MAG: hypothetical protein IT372_07695 [Polyangiaceae bacterium]|nr:hypothetical protein [Polyangiaceae bacterium]